MLESTLNFQPRPFVPSFSAWDLVNASIQGDILTISPTGHATITLTTEVATEFKYYKIAVDFSSLSASQVWNYASSPRIFIEEVYLNDDKEVDRVNYRSLGFNVTNPSANVHNDISILETYNSPMKRMKITILNDTPSALTIHKLGIASSVDINERQVAKVVAEASTNASAKTMLPYFNESGVMTGIGFLTSDTEELKLGLKYYNGRLVKIDTNFGQTVSVFPILGDPDLATLVPSYVPPSEEG